jgi:hypothetical protein
VDKANDLAAWAEQVEQFRTAQTMEGEIVAFDPASAAAFQDEYSAETRGRVRSAPRQ